MAVSPNNDERDHPVQVVDRNIRALLERSREQDRSRNWQDRLADRITRFTGSMVFVYLHVVIFGLWIVINVGWLPLVPRFDPSLVILAMAASVEAIFLSTFVLITQNRMAAISDQRANLDLQISLLAEYEVTRLIGLMRALAVHLDLDEARDPELNELVQDVKPEAVLDQLERHTAG